MRLVITPSSCYRGYMPSKCPSTFLVHTLYRRTSMFRGRSPKAASELCIKSCARVSASWFHGVIQLLLQHLFFHAADGRVMALKQVKLAGMKRVDRQEAIDEVTYSAIIRSTRQQSSIADTHIICRHVCYLNSATPMSSSITTATLVSFLSGVLGTAWLRALLTQRASNPLQCR